MEKNEYVLQTSGVLRQETKCNGGLFGTISKIRGDNGIKLKDVGVENGTRWRADENNRTERDGVSYKRSDKCTVRSNQLKSLLCSICCRFLQSNCSPSVRTKNPIAVRLITVFKISTFAPC